MTDKKKAAKKEVKEYWKITGPGWDQICIETKICNF